MLIELTKVLEQDGKTILQEAHLEAEHIKVSGLEYKIRELEPVKLEITNMGKKLISIKGTAKAEAAIPCDRCLKDVRHVFSLSFEREVDMKLSEDERKLSEEEYNFIEDTNLNTDTLVQNELLINWPVRTLCKEDCKGICSCCGADLNHGECGCDREVLDPRMAAFSDIFSKFKEV